MDSASIFLISSNVVGFMTFSSSEETNTEILTFGMPTP